MGAVMNAGGVQRVILTTLLITYFLIPTTLPWVGWSPHGFVLLCALAWYAATDLKECSLEKSWPFLLVPLAVGASWLGVRGDADNGMVRSVLFGTSIAFLISQYLRGEDGIRAVVLLSWTVVAAAVLMSGLFVGAVLGAGVTQFDPFAAAFGQSSYHSALFFMVAIPAILFIAVRTGTVMLFLVLFPLWTALILSGMRGVWLGAVGAVVIFGVASKHFWQTAITMGIAVLAFASMTALTEQYLGGLNDMEAARVGASHSGWPVGRNEFGPPGDLTAATIAASNLAAKTRSGAGLDKVFEELTTSGRLGYWLAGVRMWATAPILGVGPGNFSRNSEHYSRHVGPRRDSEKSFDAHNMFVSVLAELGLVGFGAVALLMAIPVDRWCRRWRQEPPKREALALVGAVFVGLTVVGLTWDIHMQRIWWIGLGLMWAATVPQESGVVPETVESAG